jgi:hypothetical protein
MFRMLWENNVKCVIGEFFLKVEGGRIVAEYVQWWA